jgi:hypothetical protein
MTHETAKELFEEGIIRLDESSDGSPHNRSLLLVEAEEISLLLPIENTMSSHGDTGLCTAFIGFFGDNSSPHIHVRVLIMAKLSR